MINDACAHAMPRQNASLTPRVLQDTPYILGHVVDGGCDTPVESIVVHSLNVGECRMRL